MLKVYCARLPEMMPPWRFRECLLLLPGAMQQKNLRYQQVNDKLRHLCGQLLLRDALQQVGFAEDCLHHIRYNQYERPYLPGEYDFNISHSGEWVVCVIGQHVQVGVDIEAISPVDFSDFEEVMTAAQWEDIHSAADPLRAFFSYWAIKESVIKADSRGMSIPLDDIHIHNGSASIQEYRWFLQPLDLDPEYCACLATNRECGPVEIQYRVF